MKIKELFETSGSHAINISYEFSCNSLEIRKLAEHKKTIIDKIAAKAGNGCSCVISSGSSSFTVVIKIPDSQLESIHLLVDDVKSVLREYLALDSGVTENDDDRRCQVFFYGDFPKLPHPIKFDAVFLTPTNNATLSGIDKSIGECGYFEVEDCEKIKGNVLGLINLAKRGTRVKLTVKDKIPKWVSILNNHLLKKNQNIIACQKELYDNDLDDYAEL